MSDETEKTGEMNLEEHAEEEVGVLEKIAQMLREGFGGMAALITSNTQRADAALAGQPSGSPNPEAVPPEQLQGIVSTLRNRPAVIDQNLNP